MTGEHVNGNRGTAGGRPSRGSALSTVALFGATAIVGQILLLRECLIVVAGNELFIALFFGCWFLGIAAGAAIGAFLRPSRDWLAFLVPAFLLFQVALLPILMLAVRGVRARWGIEAHALMPLGSILRMTVIHLCPFSFLTGLTFPMLCRMIAAIGSGEGRSIGTVYAVESLGSLIGGAATTFILTAWLEPLTGAWILGALTAANFFWFCRRHAARGRRFAAVLSAILAVAFLIVLITPLRPTIERYGASLRHRAYGPQFEWLEERYTPYQHLALVRLGDQYSLLSNGRFISSFPDPNATSATVHLLMSQSEQPRRVLLIGGEPSWIRSLLLYPGVEIDYVEIDPQVLDLVRPYLDAAHQRALADPRVHIFHEDARHFVRRRAAEVKRGKAAPYDVVLSITPDPSTAALNRFYTVDYFREARRLLRPSGVLVTSISSGVNYFSRDLLDYVGSVYASLSDAFSHVLATPGTRAFLFATDQDDRLTSGIETLMGRFNRRGISDGDFSPLFFFEAYQTDQLDFVNQSLRESRGKAHANRDAEPITYLYHLRLWRQFSGAKSPGPIRTFEAPSIRAVIEVGLIVIVLILLFGLARFLQLPGRFAFPIAILVLALIGMTGMASSIILLLLFQNYHGSLYQDVGLLVALFMAGLTLGALIGNRWGKEDARSLSQTIGLAAMFFCGFLVVVGICAHVLPQDFSIDLLHHPTLFHILMVFAGVLTGAPFPLVGRLAAACGKSIGRTGGVLECADHLGACAGAFVTGLVLLPLAGIANTLAMFAVLLFLAGLAMTLPSRS